MVPVLSIRSVFLLFYNVFCLPTVDYVMQALERVKPPPPAGGPRQVCPPALSGRLAGVSCNQRAVSTCKLHGYNNLRALGSGSGKYK